MSVQYFVEFRLHGYSKEYAKWVMSRVHRKARRLGIRGQSPWPHITLFGPAGTDSLRRVMTEVERIGRKYTLVPFELGGFDKFQKQDANWLYLEVEPSPDLEQLRYDLAQSLLRSERVTRDTCQPFDHKSKYKFHSTIIKCDLRHEAKFEKLSEYAKTKCSLESFKQHKASVFGKLFNIIEKYIFRVEEDDPRISLNLLRVTVTVLGRRNHIQAEYDLVLKKMLSPREALSRYWWKSTIGKLRELRSLP